MTERELIIRTAELRRDDPRLSYREARQRAEREPSPNAHLRRPFRDSRRA